MRGWTLVRCRCSGRQQPGNIRTLGNFSSCIFSIMHNISGLNHVMRYENFDCTSLIRRLAFCSSPPLPGISLLKALPLLTFSLVTLVSNHLSTRLQFSMPFPSSETPDPSTTSPFQEDLFDGYGDASHSGTHLNALTPTSAPIPRALF